MSQTFRFNPIRDHPGQQREQQHGTEVSELENFDEEALVRIADCLAQ